MRLMLSLDKSAETQSHMTLTALLIGGVKTDVVRLPALKSKPSVSQTSAVSVCSHHEAHDSLFL